MAGKKKEKFRITMFFTCNVDGSECLPPMYIGKAKKPCCRVLLSAVFTIRTTRRLG
jgi:DDE superfamily endonuclease